MCATNCPIQFQFNADLSAPQWAELVALMAEMQTGPDPVLGSDGDHILAETVRRLVGDVLQERAAQRRQVELAAQLADGCWDGTALQ